MDYTRQKKNREEHLKKIPFFQFEKIARLIFQVHKSRDIL